jgi:DNA-binding transcriptional ArsR family regulator
VIADADIARVGAALADETRVAMLLALLGGEALSAGELARVAGRSPSGASSHLRRLREAGLITAEDIGRNRFFRLGSPDLAEALEALACVAPPRAVRGLRQAQAVGALRRARTCYDHLAGELGVAVTDALVKQGLLVRGDGSFALTDAGAAWLTALDVDVEALEGRRRSFARACLDWTERRPHVAGSLGAGVADLFFARGWVRRLPGGRALVLTSAGSAWLESELGVGRLS